MKYCEFGFNYIYFDNFYGDVYLCPWMEPVKCKIGNILEQDFDEIWFGEKAEQFRNEFRQECFKHCRPQACPRIQNNDFTEIDEKEFKELTKTPEYPTKINLAYDFVCNQHCETCRPNVFTVYGDYPQRMEKIRVKITPILEKAEMISMSGHGDPFASPYMMDLLENMHPTNKNLKLTIETNGVFFDEAHWAKMEHLKDLNIEVIITINSYDEFIYKHISLGGNFQKLMHNLDFVKTLREKNYLNKLTLTLVVQDRNFREIPSFIKTSLEEKGADGVLLRPVYQWGTMPETVFWFKDVLNPKHPYHQEYLEILQCEELKDPRVYNFGGDTVHPERDYPTPNIIDPETLASIQKLADKLKEARGN